MIRATVTGTAAERVDFGEPVREAAENRFVGCDPDEAIGIAHRSLLANHVEKGEPIRVVTDGELLALVRGETRWAVVQAGKVRLDD